MFSLLGGGCASLQEDGGRDFEPSWPEEAEAPKAMPGAIYAQGTDVTLWNNVTARNVGDTLTPSEWSTCRRHCAPSFFTA